MVSVSLLSFNMHSFTMRAALSKKQQIKFHLKLPGKERVELPERWTQYSCGSDSVKLLMGRTL